MRFEKYNHNPLKHKVSDCVVRAIAFGLNLSWPVVYDDLQHVGRRLMCMPNEQMAYSKYLEERPMTTYKAVKGQTREKVKDFSKGTHILATAQHLTVVKAGVLYDTHDCRERTVYRSWRID